MAVGALLAVTSAVVVLLGVQFAPQLVGLIAGGFGPDARALTVTLVRILFPGAALLVFSAWCLAILNSHGRFFLSYVAPVVWNAAMITTLVWFGPQSTQPGLAELLAWGSVAGSVLQFVVQLPWVIGYLRAGGWRGTPAAEALKRVVRNFIPVVVGRGAVQISAYIDTRIASSVAAGALAAVVYAQMLYLLPVSLFGMAVSAAELPAMSRVTGALEEIRAGIRERLVTGLRRIAFFVVPSAVALIVLGDVIAGALFERGEFTAEDTIWVWQILAAAGAGLLAATLARLYASAFYALRDTRTPLKFAVIRIVVSAALGYALAVPLPRVLGLDPRLGAAGLMLGGAVAAWLELALLRRAIAARIGAADLEFRHVGRLFMLAVGGAVAAAAAKMLLTGAHPILVAAVALPLYGAIYLGGAYALGVREARALLSR